MTPKANQSPSRPTQRPPARGRSLLAVPALAALLLLLAAAPALAAQQPFISSYEQEAADVTAGCATLKVWIFPAGAETNYHFQYIKEAVLKENEEQHREPFEGAEETPQSALLGEGGEFITSARVCGLTHATAYQYRAVATNSFSPAGGTLGPAGAFTTLLDGPSHALSFSFGGSTSDVADAYPLAAPTAIAEDQATHDLYVTDPGANERQAVTVSATGGTYTLSFKGQTTAGLPYASVEKGELHTVQEALEGLSTIGPGNVELAYPKEYYNEGFVVTFVGALAHTNVEQLSVEASSLTGGGAEVKTIAQGAPGSAVEKFSPSGEFILIFGKGVDKSTGGNVCTAASHDTCGPGVAGAGPGELEFPSVIAVDNSDGASDGDVYVGAGDDVQKFDSQGELIAGWGEGGEITGYTDESVFHKFNAIRGLAVDSDGVLYVQQITGPNYFGFSQSGQYVVQLEVTGAEADIFQYLSSGNVLTPVPTFAYEPTASQVYVLPDGSLVQHNTACTVPFKPSPGSGSRGLQCDLTDGFGYGSLSNASGIAVEPRSNTLFVANTGADDALALADARPAVTTGPPIGATETTITLSGEINPETHGEDHGPIVECRFEWGLTKAYGHTLPCEPDPETESHFTSTTAVKATITGLTPITDLPVGTTYHYRLVAANEAAPPEKLGAAGEGVDETALSSAPPHIEGVFTSHLTATSADLGVTIKPNGLATTYRFEYGPTTAYGHATPEGVIEGSIEELSQPQVVKAHIEDLTPGVTYHFRVIAENEVDRGHPETSEDHTFEFFPPNCPNSAVRQETGSAYLPDCRAYELVSPSNANATLLYPGGPNTGQATSPPRFAFTGNFNSLPGTSTIETAGDLYLATRTDTGWVSRYIGLPGDQDGCMGGPPTAHTSARAETASGIYLDDTVLTNPSMSRLLNFKDGGAVECFGNVIFGEGDWQVVPPSNAPYLWSSEGNLLQRLPSDLAALPGAVEALSCPYENHLAYWGVCSGETTASAGLDHIFFSTNKLSLSEPPEPPGLTTAPGSAYDDDLSTGKLELISKLPDGSPIPQPQPENVGTEEFLRFPAVSEDGSRVLISTATAATPVPCLGETLIQEPGPINTRCQRFIDTPIHLYMRVGGGLGGATYEVAEDQTTHEPTAVNYVGITPDGSRVYFTSSQQLIPGEETDGNTELYMWSTKKAEEGKQPLSLISKPNGGSDNSTECHPAETWTQECDAVPWSDYSWSLQSEARGGNGNSDSPIVKNGDIYFYSPAQLVADRGVEGLENLYDYVAASEEVRFIATLPPEQRCTPEFTTTSAFGGHCSEGPILRLEASADDSHLAFLTGARLTPYDNAGHTELYSYEPTAETLTCDSCNPDGRPATADVEASQDGLFQTEDGRTFFSTTESVVPQDTDRGEDVYEYVDGRPQLITPGTGTGTAATGGLPGLVGVSANGTDVYFSTYDTLVTEDHNGNFLKFYDARTDGGFPQPPPAQPCAAAEECHGPGTEAPVLPTQGTAATLAGGNATPETHAKKHKRKSRRHHKRAGHKHGGKK